MEDLKKRGKQHLKNKTKYKNRPKEKAPIQMYTKSTKLMTNLDRYNELITSDSCDIPRGADFSLLAEAPISKGSHFQFQSDVKDRFDMKIGAVDSNGLFNLDLNLLGLSVACIPFNERCGIPENYFSDTQIESLKKNAADNAKIFQCALHNDVNNTENVEDEFFTRKKTNAQSESECNENKIINNSSKLMNEISSSYSNIDNPGCGDTLDEVQKNKNNRLIHPSIDKLNELEEKLEKLELMKNDSKTYDLNICKNHQFSKNSSPLKLDQSLNSSHDMTDQLGDSTKTGASSLLETESLQQWLDDVLGD